MFICTVTIAADGVDPRAEAALTHPLFDENCSTAAPMGSAQEHIHHSSLATASLAADVEVDWVQVYSGQNSSWVQALHWQLSTSLRQLLACDGVQLLGERCVLR